jgi:hypothetical protein
MLCRKFAATKNAYQYRTSAKSLLIPDAFSSQIANHNHNPLKHSGY